jgi:hypothetical protein
VAITFEIELPAGGDLPELSRADLTFHGLDHSGPSYEVRVFFDHPDASSDTALTPDAGFVGKFSVFGHGGCFGDEGHCEIRGAVSVFDRRLPHQLVPATRVLTVTSGVRDLMHRGAGSVRVTCVPVVRPSALATAEQAANALILDQVALHTYE